MQIMVMMVTTIMLSLLLTGIARVAPGVTQVAPRAAPGVGRRTAPRVALWITTHVAPLLQIPDREGEKGDHCHQGRRRHEADHELMLVRQGVGCSEN